MKNRKCMLLILDGWGIGKIPDADAIRQADTPIMDNLIKNYPSSTLVTYGGMVGLPEGQMGNSEVGHLNIGAGRVVFQELARINNAIADNSIAEITHLKEAIELAKSKKKPIHLMGLLSDGGVHSHIDHLLGLLNILDRAEVPEVYIHCFLDGRDTSPKGGIAYVNQLLAHLKKTRGNIATIIGRYYAMDRDKRWERTRLAYDLLVKSEAKFYTADPEKVLEKNYEDGITDEFMSPIQCVDENGTATGNIKEGDIVIFYNFRTDRPRQLTEVLTQKDHPKHEMKKLDLHYLTFTEYDNQFQGVKVLFEKDNLRNTIGEVLSDKGKKQVRIAETEKYPHVTFFFSGGREEPFENETRILKPSPKVATYDLAPEMSAIQLKEAIKEAIEKDEPDFIVLNFANTDMVGHTGDFKAAMQAAEVVDACVGEIISSLLKHDYYAVIIADHGNSDFMINEDGSPNTAHSVNLVPCVLVGNHVENLKLNDGKLADIAPTILSLMGIPIPDEMTGDIIVSVN